MSRLRRRGQNRAVRFLLDAEEGAEQMDYILVFTLVLLPLYVVVRMFWEMLLYYYQLEALVFDAPFF